MLYPLIEIGGVLFWLLLALWSIPLTLVCCNGRSGAVFLNALLLGAFLQLFSTVPPLTMLSSYPLTTLGLTALYFALGTGWMFLKWILYVRFNARNYAYEKQWWMEAHGKKLPPEKQQDAWWRYFIDKSSYQGRYEYTRLEHCPRVQDNSERLFCWLVLWPWSLFWTLLNDPLSRLANWIIDCSSALLERISQQTFGDYLHDNPNNRPRDIQ